jgi:hypothetical protein
VQIVLHSLLFLLVFFDSQVRISLLGEVNRVCTVDNLRRRGAAIAGFRIVLFGSRIDLCQVSTQSLIIGTFRKIGHPSPHQLEERCMGQLIFHHVEDIPLSCASRKRHTLLCQLIQQCNNGAEILHKMVIEAHNA